MMAAPSAAAAAATGIRDTVAPADGRRSAGDAAAGDAADDAESRSASFGP